MRKGREGQGGGVGQPDPTPVRQGEKDRLSHTPVEVPQPLVPAAPPPVRGEDPGHPPKGKRTPYLYWKGRMYGENFLVIFIWKEVTPLQEGMGHLFTKVDPKKGGQIRSVLKRSGSGDERQSVIS